jgi:acyl-[acyl-carrier-protein] desaturase
VTTTDLLDALTPTVTRLFERHLATTKPWMPHELIPWARAAGSEPAGPWREDRAPLPLGVRSALVVNLLTEDNLPYYFETINRTFASEAWREWARRWTAEEMRHSIAIRDYITVTHAVDLRALEHARMAQVSGGAVPQPATIGDALAYVAVQELATRIAHRNTGTLLDDDAGYKVMARVAADENLHHIFYRDLVTAALEIDPSAMVLAIDRQVTRFEMPGTGIPDFTALAAAIADSGIYDVTSHYEQILVPVVLRHWDVERIEGLSPAADAAREHLVGHVTRVGRIAKRLAERRERRRATA